ncbi:restriction endonuclease subunit S [Butyrivibrio sp.]|uniref:restriction endonuclease subunit S n=1 Tax=Butyrivibrio sp. TaxID=28121 RepID=UPI0025B82EEC|nr:restriction endonuclease subunit S [Butyrivibrio sp.]MBQ9304501.1 restriction endonuclease subunit S [Butyrivibrio sp.]
METFNDIFVDCTSLGKKIPKDEYLDKGKHIVIDQGQNIVAGYTNLEDGLFEDVPAIIVGDHTRIIKYVDEPFFLGADGVKLLKAKKENANYKYLYYALKNARIPDTGYNRHFKWLKEVAIQYPCPEKQEKVVKVLDKLSSIIDDRTKELAYLDELIKARFVEMFGNPEIDEKYPQIAIKDFTDVISGGTPDRKNNEYWENGTVPWVKTTELQNNRINAVEESITEKGLSESSAKVVPKDTVLIAMYGQGKTRGMTAILGIPASTNQACACILPCETVEPKYLWQYMIMSYDRLRNLAQGGNQPNLNGNMIKNFTVLVPPVELQGQFVRFVEQVDKSKL